MAALERRLLDLGIIDLYEAEDTEAKRENAVSNLERREPAFNLDEIIAGRR